MWMIPYTQGQHEALALDGCYDRGSKSPVSMETSTCTWMVVQAPAPSRNRAVLYYTTFLGPCLCPKQ